MSNTLETMLCYRSKELYGNGSPADQMVHLGNPLMATSSAMCGRMSRVG